MKVIKMLMGLMLGLMAIFGAFAVDINLDKIEINDYTATSTTVPLYIERSNDLNIDLWFSASSDFKDVQVYVFIAGYEYGEIRDYSDVFDIESGVMYHKTLELELPKTLDTGDYKVRVIFADRYGELETYDLDLVVGTPRHSLEIKNVMLIPGTVVKQGDALLVAARVENMGEKDEKDVKIKVEVPELGLVQEDYIDLIESSEVLSTDYLMLNIPECADPGKYTLKVTLSYNRETKQVTETKDINVVGSGVCQATTETAEKTYITLGPKNVVIKSGEKATYVITVKNSGNTDKLYSFDAVVPAEWASVSFAPGKTFVLKPGEEKLVYITVTPKPGVSGEQMFKVVLNVNNQQEQEIPLSATIESTSASNVLEITLIVLIVVLIILGIIIGAVKSSKKEKPSNEEETYY